MILKHIGGAKWIAENDAGETVREFNGKRVDVEPEFHAWLETYEEPEVEAQGEDDEVSPVESGPNLPNPDNLSGRAKTAALNAHVDSTFVEGEWSPKSGVHTEANYVYNVPDGWQAAWSTPRNIDGGRHANYLRERGYRPVYKDEMGADMYGDELYVAYVDESDGDFVFMGGAQLFIGPSERLAKLRRSEYDAHMAAIHSKQEEPENVGAHLGGELRTSRDSSVYNPMRR